MVGNDLNTGFKSALNRLPVPQWLRRFESGTLRISGELSACETVEVGQYTLTLQPGPVRLSVVFQGGSSAFVSKMYVDSKGLKWTDANRHTTSDHWAWQDGLSVMNDTPVGRVEGRKGHAVEAMIQYLANVHVEARVVSAEDLSVRSSVGLAVNIPAGVVMTAVGCTVGAPNDLVLARPVIVGFGGDGVELGLSRFHRLSKFLAVRVHRLTLHPDGRVQVEGRGTRGMGRAVRRGLRSTGDLLSEMMRDSASFAMIRPFLVLS